MRELKKMTIGELEYDSVGILLRKRMESIKGGGGDCYVYCSSGTWGITRECDGEGPWNICGLDGFICYCF